LKVWVRFGFAGGQVDFEPGMTEKSSSPPVPLAPPHVIERLVEEVLDHLSHGHLVEALVSLRSALISFPTGVRGRYTDLLGRAQTVVNLYEAGELTGSEYQQQADRIIPEINKAAVELYESARNAPLRPRARPIPKELSGEGSHFAASDHLQLHNVFFRHGNHTVLSDTEVSVAPGSILGVVGRNGTGKTTLLRLIAGELRPERGLIAYPSPPAPYASVSVPDTISYVPQFPRSYLGSLEGSLRRFAALRGVLGKNQDIEVGYFLNLLELEAFRNHPWRSLSGGFRVRYELARSLMCYPAVLILDEPLGHLDIKSQWQYLEKLRTVAESAWQTTIVISSQELDALDEVADKLLVLGPNGRSKLFDTRGEILEGVSSRLYEVGTSRKLFELQGILGSIVSDVILVGQRARITTEVTVPMKAVLSRLIEADNDLRYFRDLPVSSQRLVESATHEATWD
jgi:ABC-type multidrug transport system ATPase subunit